MKDLNSPDYKTLNDVEINLAAITFENAIKEAVKLIVDLDDTELAILCIPIIDRARRELDYLQAVPPIARRKRREQRGS